MRILKIIGYTLLVLIALVAVGGFILIGGIKKGALPRYEGELTISGINSEVTVLRDERGMPHIYAENEPDLYFAVGYVMAQERLWQMDFLRRVTTGRVSEIIGDIAVDYDLMNLSLDIADKSKRLYDESIPDVKNCLESFSAGVNRYINDSGKKLPPEFKILRYTPDPWKPEDALNIIGYMSWDLASGALDEELFNYELVKKFGVDRANSIIPDWRAVESSVFPDFRLDEKTLEMVKEYFRNIDKAIPSEINIFSGSNNWAVSGTRSETGKPILCNDMHLGFGSPGIWMQMHQVVPGKLNVTGVVVPCQPFVVAGHNEKIAWGETNLMVDGIDLYVEKINPEDSNQYFYDGEWRNMTIRNTVIKIKGGTEKTFNLRFSHRGVIISDRIDPKGEVISMRWSGYDNSREIMTVYLLNRASNWDEFRTAISNFRSASQNFVYADIDGNIGLNTGGGIALRKGDGTIIRSGETSEYDWKGYVPFEQLPTSFNPERGYVSSANNKTVSDDYPYHISGTFYVPYRIDRIRQMLDEKEKFGTEDMKRMQTDQHSSYAALLTPIIIKSCETISDMNPTEKFAFDALKTWDYDMNKDKVAPSVFEFFRERLAQELLGDELGSLYDDIYKALSDYYIYKVVRTGADAWVDDTTTPEAETLDEILVRSFRKCITDISEQVTPDTSGWKWGDIHRITIEHPLAMVKILDRVFKLNSKEYRVGGSNHTVSPYSYVADFKINDGASQRHIFNTADWDDSYTVIPTGSSGIPASEFYLSQTDSYINGIYYKDAFTEPAVKAAAKYKLLLKPAK